MFKNVKKKIMLVVLTVFALGSIMSVSAATMASSVAYAGCVTKTAEYVADREDYSWPGTKSAVSVSDVAKVLMKGEIIWLEQN